MSHDITATDGAVYYKEKAWHGLGYVVEESITPKQALVCSGLDWEVSKGSGITNLGGMESSQEFCPIIRKDTGTILSVQSPQYQLVQNHEVFDLAYALGEGVKVESALSLQGGKKIICLLRGETFAPSTSKDDTMVQYFALLNSHDGTLALSGLPTSVRIVCANTLKMALRNPRKGLIRFTHTGDIVGKQHAMRTAMKTYAETGVLFKEAVEAMSSSNLTTSEIQEFWLGVYAKLEEPVVANPKTADEYENNLKATVTMSRWSNNFDEERKELHAPPSMWQAVNAVTKDIQHHKNIKGRQVSWDSRAYNVLFGDKQDLSIQVFNAGLYHV